MAAPITPVRAKWDRERNEWIWGISEEDFDRIQKGFACVRCLEGFDSYHEVCPVCGQETKLPDSVADLPPEWLYS